MCEKVKVTSPASLLGQEEWIHTHTHTQKHEIHEIHTHKTQTHIQTLKESGNQKREIRETRVGWNRVQDANQE